MVVTWLDIVPAVLVFIAVTVIVVMLLQTRRVEAEKLRLMDIADMAREMQEGGDEANEDEGMTHVRRRAVGGSGRGVRASARMRMRARAAAASAVSVEDVVGGQLEDDGDEGVEDEEGTEEDMFGGQKKKKAANRQAKAEARAAREARVEAQREREEKRLEESQKRAEEEELKEQMREEEERKIQEEKERAEEEEYQKWKSVIAVENTGDQESTLQEESQGLLGDFVNYIKTNKVVVLEELAAHFHLRTDDVVNRVQSLETMGYISGVFDDRGKYIFISSEEMDQIASMIRKRGRISIQDLSREVSRIVLPNVISSPAPSATV